MTTKQKVNVLAPQEIADKIYQSDCCPNCGSDRVTANNRPTIEHDRDAFRCKLECDKCGTTWDEIYKMEEVQNYAVRNKQFRSEELESEYEEWDKSYQYEADIERQTHGEYELTIRRKMKKYHDEWELVGQFDFYTDDSDAEEDVDKLKELGFNIKYSWEKN